MFSSKKVRTLSDGCANVMNSDFRTIFEMQKSGNALNISIMHSND